MRDITLEETIYLDFTTRAFATGIPTVLAGTPVLSVLEENNATPITSGVSVGVDRASVVGLNMATVVATAANGYESGKGYSVYISTGTVGGVSVVGEVVAEFTIEADAGFKRLGAPAGASVSADIADVPTNSEFNARTLPSANYFDPAADTVANVTTVNTNTDMRGTDSANTTTPPTAVQNRQEMDSNSTQLASILADTNELQIDDIPGLIASLNDLSAGQVNAEVLDVLSVDTFAQPGQGAPAGTQTLATMIAFLYKAWRNRSTQTASEYALYNDDATTIDQKAAFSDDSTTADTAEVTTGP